MFFKDFVSVKRQKIKRGASQTYDTPSSMVRRMCPTPSSLQVWALTRIAVEPSCPGFIPIRDSIFRFGGTCSTVKVDGRPGRDSLPTNRIIIKDYENWCFLASIVAVFLFFALSIKEFGNAMQRFNGNRHLS